MWGNRVLLKYAQPGAVHAFNLFTVSQNDVKNVIKNLCNNKANLIGSIPAKKL